MMMDTTMLPEARPIGTPAGWEKVKEINASLLSDWERKDIGEAFGSHADRKAV